MSPVEELRSAAVLLRQRAEDATPGPWRYDPDMFDNGAILTDSPEVNQGWDRMVGETTSERDADSKWRATMDPLVGLALAELLEHIADDLSDDGGHEVTSAPKSWVVDNYGSLRSDWTAALALARLILGGTS